MEDGIFPGEMAKYNEEDMEEERRLCYVAITRAKKELYLSTSRTRMIFGQTRRNPPSAFLSEIDPGLLDETQSPELTGCGGGFGAGYGSYSTNVPGGRSGYSGASRGYLNSEYNARPRGGFGGGYSSGFASGGDDYVLKPFSIDELGARVAAHLRRETRRARAAVVRMDGGLAINYTDRTVTFEGKPLAFARKEFDIIELLSQNPGQVFDKERIYERVWGLDGTGDASLVAERVRRIRAGLAVAGAKPYIQTVWGCGYKWVE